MDSPFDPHSLALVYTCTTYMKVVICSPHMMCDFTESTRKLLTLSRSTRCEMPQVEKKEERKKGRAHNCHNTC
jgi:hypothetical protein